MSVGRAFFGTAALSLASRLDGIGRSAVAATDLQSVPSTPSEEAATSSSTAGLVGRLIVDMGSSILQRELRHGVVPALERSLRTMANATPVQALSAEESLGAWSGIRMSADDLWVDIGSGNGDTLGRMAARHPGRFLGVDKENSEALFFEVRRGARHLEALPPNVRYLLLSYNRPGHCQIRHERLQPVPTGPWADRPSDADMAMDATVDTIGAASAAVVSLFFPYSESRKRHLLGRLIQGPVPQVLDYQFRTAVRLLRPGGLGVAILEATPTADRARVLERALSALKADPDLQWIGFTPEGFDVASFGVAPYAPQDERGRAVDTQALHLGRAVFFSKKG